MNFQNLNLHPSLVKAVNRSGFKTPTEIQAKSFPVITSGRDLMASAQTGTGKTAAFSLPTIQNLMAENSRRQGGPKVLILTPTRELAMQVKDCMEQFTKFTPFSCGLVVGGMGYGPQIKMIKRGVDVLIATPGRLKDHMERGIVNFKNLEILILDEADRMLDMGFIKDIRRIAAATPKERQTLLFSATLEGQVLKVAKELMNNPQSISLASNTQRHKSIDQRAYFADAPEHKFKLLTHLLAGDNVFQAVIFTKTKRGADKLAKKLNARDFRCAPLHGNMAQGKRKRTLDLMRRGKINVLVATDVAARGLDIDGITHVFNFDMPMVAEDYIHRIGRTGRAGAKGIAISLVTREDRGKLRDIEKLTGQRTQFDSIEGLESDQKPDVIRFPKKPSNKPSRGKRHQKGRPSERSRSKGKKQQAKKSRRAPSKKAA